MKFMNKNTRRLDVSRKTSFMWSTTVIILLTILVVAGNASPPKRKIDSHGKKKIPSEKSESQTQESNGKSMNVTFLYTGRLYPKAGMSHIIIPVNLTEVFGVAKQAQNLIDEARKVPIFEAHFSGSDLVTAGTLTRKNEYLKNGITDLEAELLGLVGIPRRRVEREVNLNVDVGSFIGSILQGVSNLFSHNEINQIKANQNHLVSKIVTLDTKIDELGDELDELEKRFVFALTEIKWLAITNRMIQGLDHAIQLVPSTIQAVVDLNNGVLSTGLLNLAQAKKAHSVLRNKIMQSGLKLTYDDAIDLYSARTSWIVTDGAILEIVVHCPVYDEESRSGSLRLYEVPNLPMMINGTTVTLETPVTWIGISDGLDADKAYIEFEEGDFEESCEEFAPYKFICATPLVLKKNIETSCQASLLIGKLSESCVFSQIEKPKPKVVQLYSGAVYLYLPNETEVAEICRSETKTYSWFGVMRYIPRPGCRLETVSFTIPERVIAPKIAVEAIMSIPLSNKIFFGKNNLTVTKGGNRSVERAPRDNAEWNMQMNDTDIVQTSLILILFLCVLCIFLFLLIRSRQLSD